MNSIAANPSTLTARRGITRQSPANILAAIGLTLGGVLGMLGSFVHNPVVRNYCWGMDSVGVIVATALLTLKYFRAAKDLVAAGFLVFTVGEAVMLSGTASSLEGSVPAFAAGVTLWSAALLLVSVPRHFPAWTRSTGVVASIVFAVTAAEIFGGGHVLPTSAPLPVAGYPFLVLSFAGWVRTLLSAENEN